MLIQKNDLKNSYREFVTDYENVHFKALIAIWNFTVMEKKFEIKKII